MENTMMEERGMQRGKIIWREQTDGENAAAVRFSVQVKCSSLMVMLPNSQMSLTRQQMQTLIMKQCEGRS